jgi:glycosyltransferase involved in cell wall biosynthesis
MRDGKIRVLLVIAHLAQGGSERFVYEFAKALDRSRFDLEVLTKRRPRSFDVYESKLEEIGVRLHRKLPILLHYTRRIAGPLYRFAPIRALVDMPHKIHARSTMGHLLEEFDVIYVVQIENYYLIQPLVADNDRLITHLMSSAFQYRTNPYNDCRPGRDYRFIIYDPTQPADYAGSPARNARSTMFPHALDLSGRGDLSPFIRTEPPFRLGVFQRLHRERQFSGLFEAFAAIAASADAELILYGRGDTTQFDQELEALGIRDRVRFAGHAPSIESALREGDLSAVLSTSHNAILGYGSIEVASHGFPIFFWNVGTLSREDVLAATHGAMSVHSDPRALAAEALVVLQSDAAQKALGQRLRQYVFETYDMARHIAILEHEIESVAERA